MGFPDLRFGLVLDATECCVDVRIMRLEPVSERPPQHARGGARRATLHHVVLAVKETRGVTRIEGHRRESRKCRELRPRPFPPITHKIMHAKRAPPAAVPPHHPPTPSSKLHIPLR